nr:unnamed protein product [Digitaria exilis]
MVSIIWLEVQRRYLMLLQVWVQEWTISVDGIGYLVLVTMVIQQAISNLQRETGVSIPLVVFGHMHKSLAYGRGLRKMIAFGANNTIYLNGAVVPRVRYAQASPSLEQNQPDGSVLVAPPTLRAFTIADLSEGRVEKISEVWVLVSGARTELGEEVVLYNHPREHM